MIKKFFKKIDGFMRKSYTKLFKKVYKPAPKKRGRPKKNAKK